MPIKRYIDRHLPVIQSGEDKWHDLNSDFYYTTEEIIELYANQIPEKFIKSVRPPEWLQSVVSSVDVHLVETQRLLLVDKDDRSIGHSRRRHAENFSVVDENAKHLSLKISKLLQKYANKSQEFDQSFPKRVIEKISSETKTEGEIREELNKLSKKRERLMSVGLLSSANIESIQPSDDIQENKVRNILDIYIGDTKKKLDIFDNIYESIMLFKKIIDENFFFKSIEFSANEGFIFIDENPDDSAKEVPLSKLSSGEQHELVLIYDLLFKVNPGSTILIDEPELSLHVAWQKRFISDLQEIQGLKDINVLIATHSPQIINKNWHLVQNLEYVKNEQNSR